MQFRQVPWYSSTLLHARLPSTCGWAAGEKAAPRFPEHTPSDPAPPQGDRLTGGDITQDHRDITQQTAEQPGSAFCPRWQKRIPDAVCFWQGPGWEHCGAGHQMGPGRCCPGRPTRKAQMALGPARCASAPGSSSPSRGEKVTFGVRQPRE